MTNHILKAAILLCGLAVSFGCSHQNLRQYYRLDYPESEQHYETPHPITLNVRELEASSTYRGTEIVYRPDVHEIQYYRSRRWSEKPQPMLTNLLRTHLQRSGLFQEVTDGRNNITPDYTLIGAIDGLEEFQQGGKRHARLAMSFKLIRNSDDQKVWQWRFDEQKPVSGEEVLGTIRVLSDMTSQQFDLLQVELDNYLKSPETYRPKAEAPLAPNKSETEATSTVLKWSKDDPLNDHPEVLSDDTPMPLGYGAIFLPSLSNHKANGARQPLVVVSQNGKAVSEGRMGERIVLKPGTYQINYGSGSFEEQFTQQVEVESGRTVVIPPTYASLEINVMDKTFVPYRGTYELIRMETREDVGVGFGADEQQGEDVKIWVLKPGLYKIIQSGGTYRDRINFSTVRLSEGESTRFILVVDEETGDFLGAGEADEDKTKEKTNKLKFTAVIGGDATFNRDEQLGQQDGWLLGGNLFFDGSLRYNSDPHNWITRIELEEGQQRPAGAKHFQNVTDRFYLHSIYTYNLLKWFGPYVRAGVETKLLPRYIDFDSPTDVVELNKRGESLGGVDEEGNNKPSRLGVTRIKLGGTFSPIQLKEGAGGNFRLMRSRYGELDLRAGFGARQTFARDTLAYENGVLLPVKENTLEGLEGTVVGLARITRSLTLSTEFEGFLPFSSDSDTLFTWRNQLSLRLSSFLSLNYRLNLTRDPNLGIGDDVKSEHDIQLRFSYTLF